MNSLRLLPFFFLWMIPFTIYGQRTVSGHIIDAADKEPLVSASVFVANTTIGAITDSSGFYQLNMPEKGSLTLTVSYVGYEPFFKDIEPGTASFTLDVALQIHVLDEVTVLQKVRFRQKDIDLFWNTVLGKKPSKKTLYAENPESVYYFYNSETGILTATCSEPLQIIDNEKGYHIQYVTHHFKHNYKTNISSWKGQPVFTELEPKNYKQKTTWENNRKKIYEVSLANFIKALYHNKLKENGYLLTYPEKENRPGYLQKGIYENPEIFLSDSLDDGGKTFKIPPRVRDLLLVCFGRPVTEQDLIDVSNAQINLTNLKNLSKDQMKKQFYEPSAYTEIPDWQVIGIFRNFIQTPDAPVCIFADGTFSNPILLYPCYYSNSLLGLNMKLPLEYIPDYNVKSRSLVSEDDIFK